MAGLFTIAMLLASIYSVPELAMLQHPKTKDALLLALRCLQRWKLNAGIAAKAGSFFSVIG
jgi:hypothetical protein